MTGQIVLDSRPAGPVARAFKNSRASVNVIIGPVGSAKTSTCLQRLLEIAYEIQAPHPVDNVRRTKFLIVRDTYRQLEKTTLPTWHRMVPRDLPTWTGGEGGRPGKHELSFAVKGADGRLGKVETTFEFAGIGELAAEDFARGFEPTAIYLNEADLISKEVFTQLKGRLGAGRFPPVDRNAGFAGPTWAPMFLDCNAPNVDNWIYQDFIESPIEGSAVFIQPSGLSSEAENLHNLAPGYYEKLIIGQPDWWIRQMVRNEFGHSRAGQPVYGDFSDHRNVAKHLLEPIRELPLVIGADAGLTPAAVFCQQMPNGQWRVIDEICAFGMGAQRFGKEIERLLDGAGSRYRGMKKISAWCDPAAAARSSNDERSWVEIVSEASGLKFKVAQTNALPARLGAVQRPLSPERTIDHDVPGLLISPSCKVLRKGFNGAYRFRKVQVANNERFEEEPDKKDPTSHVHDALQYALMGGGEYAEVTGRARRRRERLERDRAAGPQRDYDPFAW
jgi:hypothetical protein